MGLEKILELINDYGYAQYEEGQCVATCNWNIGIKARNRSERIFEKLLKELEMVIWD